MREAASRAETRISVSVRLIANAKIACQTDSWEPACASIAANVERIWVPRERVPSRLLCWRSVRLELLHRKAWQRAGDGYEVQSTARSCPYTTGHTMSLGLE
jgi:hypothetical protein